MIARYNRQGDVNPEFALWFVGFIEGEGCFSVEKAKCAFIVKLRADDYDVLEKARVTLGGIGTICLNPGVVVGMQQPQARWAVQRKKELIWLTEFFDCFRLQTKKARDYEVWREAVIAWYSGTNDLTDYVARIRAARSYREPACSA